MFKFPQMEPQFDYFDFGVVTPRKTRKTFEERCPARAFYAHSILEIADNYLKGQYKYTTPYGMSVCLKSCNNMLRELDRYLGESRRDQKCGELIKSLKDMVAKLQSAKEDLESGTVKTSKCEKRDKRKKKGDKKLIYRASTYKYSKSNYVQEMDEFLSLI